MRFIHSLRVSVLGALFVLGIPSGTCAQRPPIVNVGGSSVVGTSQNFGGITIDFFGGIPFAAPPVGERRFAAPVLQDGVAGDTLIATEYGAPCVQFDVDGVSEDCLTLNVYRPAPLSSNASLPVMVWIYGGGFSEGFTSIFNASMIISQSIQRGTPVLFASMNYRVGPFGFPQGSEAGLRGAVNLGLKDQLVALQWIQNHISAFGGDPSKVTLFGQSAGSISIAELSLNSGLENYVRGLILESGTASTLPLFNATRRQEGWDTFVDNVPACANATEGDTFTCMQSVDTATLLASWNATAAALIEPFVFVPVIDGSDGLIPDLASKLLAAGKFSKIPTIAGTVLDEGTSFVPQTLASQDELIEFFTIDDQAFGNPTAIFEQDLNQFLELYPDNPALGSPFGTGNETFGLSSEYKRGSAILGDVSFQAPRRAWLQAARGVPTFGYMFTDQNAVTDPSKGVTHASEVPYVFGEPILTSANPAVRLLSSAMLDYWISFTVSLTPNDGKGLPKSIWPQYQPDQQVLVQFDTTNFTANASFASFQIIPDDYRAQQISFINSVAADIEE